jgi:ribosomal protein S18 acetylase RimI-like enzyme
VTEAIPAVKGVSIRELRGSEVLRLRRELAVIWPEASRDRITEILPRHVAREGFRFLGAFDEEGAALVGFVYGYRGASGQWWHDRVARALGRSGSRRWLPEGHFEFTELHVQPVLRRRGIGGALHDAILEGLDAPTAVLSTQTDNDPAIRLYEGRGWEVIVPYLDFGSGRPFLIMGRDAA